MNERRNLFAKTGLKESSGCQDFMLSRTIPEDHELEMKTEVAK